MRKEVQGQECSRIWIPVPALYQYKDIPLSFPIVKLISIMPVPIVHHSEVDVLIIGAGPAGLMCANALANARVNVRIVDKR